MRKEHPPPDPSRIDVLRDEIESDLAVLSQASDSTGPTLDMIASKLDELISIAKALEARGRKVSPKTKVALWHLGARLAAEIIKRIVSVTHNCQFFAFIGKFTERRLYAWRLNARPRNPRRPACRWLQATRARRGLGRDSHVHLAPRG